MRELKQSFYKFFSNSKVGKFVINANFRARYSTTTEYWESRYLKNGTSGNGSYGDVALHKAGILNKFVADNKITKVIEFGCGDGNQLKLLKIPYYIGLDVSVTAIEKCINIFRNDSTKSFFIYNHKGFADNIQVFKAELVLSLDVVYHLVEGEVYENYMHHLFSSSSKFVIIYAWDVDGEKKFHVRHRKFSEWIAKNKPGWHLREKIENSAAPTCDFFIYEKV